MNAEPPHGSMDPSIEALGRILAQEDARRARLRRADTAAKHQRHAGGASGVAKAKARARNKAAKASRKRNRRKK